MTSPPITDPRLLSLIGSPTPVDTVNSPALSSTIAMPSAPAPMIPSAISLTPTQTQRDISRRNDLVNSGDGISQIKNPLGRGIARAADITASVLNPLTMGISGRLERALPGTMGHHDVLVNQMNQKVQQDQAQDQAGVALQDSQAQVQQRQAMAQQEQAKVASLADPQKAGDPTKTVQTDDGVFQFNPDTGKYDSRVGDRVEKPKTPEQAAYEAYLGQGMTPPDAFKALNEAKNTKDATFQQQFLDAYRKAHPGVSDTDAISATIRATSTEPKIQVINAGAANRDAAKNTPLDTSDPAMQTSIASVAHGDTKLTDVFGRGATTAQKAQFVAAVKQVNPNYNSGDHDIENSARRYMISGQGGQTLNAINTAYHHLDNFDAAATALKGGNSKALNQIANELGVQVQNGASPQVTFDLVKTALKGEMARAFTGAGATVDEQHALDVSFNNANSPETMLAVTKQARSLLQGKEKALSGQLQAGQRGQANFGAIEGSNAPSEGATKTNSHGDPIVFRGGKWGPA